MSSTRLKSVFLIASALAGCATKNTNWPSLAPRAAESIDPRIPIAERADTTSADAALGAKLDRLVRSARDAVGAFDRVMTIAERFAAGAGAPKSESWIVAQEALSAAVAARYPVTRALAEIDALAAERVTSKGGITPADQHQFDAATKELRPTDARQAARIRAVQARLGI